MDSGDPLPRAPNPCDSHSLDRVVAEMSQKFKTMKERPSLPVMLHLLDLAPPIDLELIPAVQEIKKNISDYVERETHLIQANRDGCDDPHEGEMKIIIHDNSRVKQTKNEKMEVPRHLVDPASTSFERSEEPICRRSEYLVPKALVSGANYQHLKEECKTILEELHNTPITVKTKQWSSEKDHLLKKQIPPEKSEVLCFDCGVDQVWGNCDGDLSGVFFSADCFQDDQNEAGREAIIDAALSKIRKAMEENGQMDGLALPVESAISPMSFCQAFQVVLEQDALDLLLEMAVDEWAVLVKLILKLVCSDEEVESGSQSHHCVCEGSNNACRLSVVESLVNGIVSIADALQLYELLLQLLDVSHALVDSHSNATDPRDERLLLTVKLVCRVTTALADLCITGLLGDDEIETVLHRLLKTSIHSRQIDYFVSVDEQGTWLDKWMSQAAVTLYYISILPISQPDTMKSILMQVEKGNCYAANILSMVLPVIGGKYTVLSKAIGKKSNESIKKADTICSTVLGESAGDTPASQCNRDNESDSRSEKKSSFQGTPKYSHVDEFSMEQEFMLCCGIEEFVIQVVQSTIRLTAACSGESTVSCSGNDGAGEILVNCFSLMRKTGVQFLGVQHVLWRMVVSRLYEVQLLNVGIQKSTMINLLLRLVLSLTPLNSKEEGYFFEDYCSSAVDTYEAVGSLESQGKSEILDEWISDSYQKILSHLQTEYPSGKGIKSPIPAELKILFSLQSFCSAFLCRNACRLTRSLDTILKFADRSHPAHIFFVLSNGTPFSVSRILVSASLDPFGWYQLCRYFSTAAKESEASKSGGNAAKSGKAAKCFLLSSAFGISTRELLLNILTIEKGIEMFSINSMGLDETFPVFCGESSLSPSYFHHFEQPMISSDCAQLLQRWSTASRVVLQPSLTEVAHSMLKIYSDLTENGAKQICKEEVVSSHQNSILGIPVERTENDIPTSAIFSVCSAENSFVRRIHFWQSLYHMLFILQFPFQESIRLNPTRWLSHQQLWNEIVSFRRVYPFHEKSFFRLLSIFSWSLWLDPLAGEAGTQLFHLTDKREEENEYLPYPHSSALSWISAWLSTTPGEGAAEILMRTLMYSFVTKDIDVRSRDVHQQELIRIVPLMVSLVQHGPESALLEEVLDVVRSMTNKTTERFLSGSFIKPRSADHSDNMRESFACSKGVSFPLTVPLPLLKILSNCSLDHLYAYCGLLRTEAMEEVSDESLAHQLWSVAPEDWQGFLSTELISLSPCAVVTGYHCAVWDIVHILCRDEEHLVNCLRMHGIDLFWLVHVALTQWLCAPKSPRNLVRQATLRSLKMFLTSGYQGWKEWLAKKLAHFYHSSIELFEATVIPVSDSVQKNAETQEEKVFSSSGMRNYTRERGNRCCRFIPSAHFTTNLPLGPPLVASYILIYGFMDPFSVVE